MLGIMLGIILFWIQYIIAYILLYHIITCIYVKTETAKTAYYTYYSITDNDERLMHPLWLIIVFIVVSFIPLVNIVTFVLYLIFRLASLDGFVHNPYYCKSMLTKKY